MDKRLVFLKSIYFSLPVQLLIRHIQRNQLILGSWILLLLVITQSFGRVLGIPFLFLDPEYMGTVGFGSFFMVGLALGGFIVAFNITSYILYCNRFSFIGILEKPFSKFSINNSLLPLLVLVVYFFQITRFQINNEFATTLDILKMLGGFLLGIVTMISLLYGYFSLTNNDIFQYLSGKVDKRLKKIKVSRRKVLEKLKESKEHQGNVESYLDLRLKRCHTRQLAYFYDKEAVLKVFDQNHFNSVVIESLVIGVILILRFFMDIPYFQIPAAASAILLLTIFIMVAGAFSYWFRAWGAVVGLILFFSFNIIMKYGWLNSRFEAAGLNYEVEKADYSIENILESHGLPTVNADKKHSIQILENWRAKWDSTAKPKMILVCASGGGQRAALWTFNTLLTADSLLNDQLLSHTMVITGASGGVVGAAYYRELKLLEQNGRLKKPVKEYRDNIAKDNLNPVIFSLVVNDLVLRNQFYSYAGQSYLKDRGYAFEEQLNRNTEYVLNKKLLDYQGPEFKAKTPMLILAPAIALDGRKLYISPQPLSYMNVASETFGDAENHKLSSIDFMRFFKNQGASQLKFLTALRMNASFPYVTPNVALPSDPPIEVMDAGIADNFGVSDAIKFLFNFKTWIAQNTSGVIVLSIRDTRKRQPINGSPHLSIVERFSSPISSVYNNLGNQQDINNDYQLAYAKEWFDGQFDVISIEYNTSSIFDQTKFSSKTQEYQRKELERASLSWHLTQKEKKNIIENIQISPNQKALLKLQELVLPKNKKVAKKR